MYIYHSFYFQIISSSPDNYNCIFILGIIMISEEGCLASEFQCGDGACINPLRRCDFFVDCLDGSDEFSCGI